MTPALIQIGVALFGLALLISSVGFYRLVYFISIGYAFAIAAMAVVAPIVLRHNLTWVAGAQNLCLLLWGLRLGAYLLRRELQPSYRKELQSIQRDAAGLTWPRKLPVWIGVSPLYVAMFSPSLFNQSAAPAATSLAGAVQTLGLITMAGSLALEAAADRQKLAFKAQSTGRFCDVGLYRWIRCPNYLGEILFWVGNWIVGLAAYTSPVQWLLSLIWLGCIVLIMLGSTRRLEHTQDERYGSLPAYQTYTRTVRVIFPWVPVYTLKPLRVYLG